MALGAWETDGGTESREAHGSSSLANGAGRTVAGDGRLATAVDWWRMEQDGGVGAGELRR
jgi:hypothetical protein